MTNVFWIGSAIALAAALSQSACLPLSCTEVGCLDALNIRASYSRAPISGRHEFIITADGETVTRDCDVMFPGPGTFGTTCNDNMGEPFSVLFLPDGDSGVSILVTGRPAAVHIEVRREGMMLASSDYSPEYKPQFPNGEECGAACHAASVTLALD